MTGSRMGARVILLGLLVLAIGACAPTPDVPTLMVLPTITAAPLTSATPVPPTAQLATIAPLLPTATPVASSTPVPSPLPTGTPVPISDLTVLPDRLTQGLHSNCTPQTAEVRVNMAGPLPDDAQVLLKWDYSGQFTSRPGNAMEALSATEYRGTLGPFERAQDVVYRVIVIQGRSQEISEDYMLAVEECTASTPAPTSPYGIQRTATPTPTYGADLSVQATNQTVTTEVDTALQITLSWRGGVSPYTISRVIPPRYGVLDGVGPVRVYIPPANFSGIDSFTYVVTDGNGQASMGTITIYVGMEPPTDEP